jgi:murein DD-endopeptidase MepM/ murein hydrolase activator NlpD
MPYNEIKAKKARERFVDVIMKRGAPQLTKPLAGAHWKSSPYGMRQHPVLGVPKLHEGIDYAASPGSPIYASEDGWIDGNTPDPVGGYKVTVKHPQGFQSRYLHMSKLSERGLKGGEVKRGDLLGYVGSTGRSTGPHLHFGLRRHGASVDPEPFYGMSYEEMEKYRGS